MTAETTRTITLYCDGREDEPTAWVNGQPRYNCPEAIATEGTVPEARRWAEREGWTSFSGMDHCPRHKGQRWPR